MVLMKDFYNKTAAQPSDNHVKVTFCLKSCINWMIQFYKDMGIINVCYSKLYFKQILLS